jgi:hypothetical protein
VEKFLTFTTHAEAAADEARHWRAASVEERVSAVELLRERTLGVYGEAIDGVTFAEAWDERLEARFGEQTVAFFGKRLLIENKLATGRAKDRLDVELLREGDDA